MAEIEVWIVVDENGDYTVGADLDSAAERYGEDVGGDNGSLGIRHVKVTLKVPLPKPIELTGEVPAPPEGTSLTAA